MYATEPRCVRDPAQRDSPSPDTTRVHTSLVRSKIMPLSPNDREQVANELKRFATEDLNLSTDQKEKLHGFLTEAYEKVQEYRKQNPNATREDLIRKIAENRTAIRERLTKFLTPEQLTKWDAEVAKAKEFLGQKAASA